MSTSATIVMASLGWGLLALGMVVLACGPSVLSRFKECTVAEAVRITCLVTYWIWALAVISVCVTALFAIL